MTYRAHPLGTEVPSFPSGNSYIDLCLADARLVFKNTPTPSTLETIEYDSDHNAVLMQVRILNLTKIELEQLPKHTN